MEEGGAVVILSGGMDSTTLLYWMLEKMPDGRRLEALSFDYGQRHRRELEHAALVCEAARVPHEVVDLSEIRDCLRGSALTDDGVAVPHGHYQDASMKETVVPNRNMILLSVAAGYCFAWGKRMLAYAAHAGDHAIYPDCRPGFIEAMRGVLAVAHYEPLMLLTPFSAMTKADIVREGDRLRVPWELTYSCYEGGDLHCGRCGTCTERREAFGLADSGDPTRYAR
ncbi:MAG: 7-cyano-7-deazaguanine synthase QueC [bacterium]|nr:7-cyano-7-deazaguanine synthase QueC [bacterium]